MPGLHPGGELPCRLFCLGLVGLVLERCADGGGGAAEDQDGPAEDEKKYLSTIPTEINCALICTSRISNGLAQLLAVAEISLPDCGTTLREINHTPAPYTNIRVSLCRKNKLMNAQQND